MIYILRVREKDEISVLCSHFVVIAVVDFLSRWPAKPRQDYNELFGYKYDLKTGKLLSGVSSEGHFEQEINPNRSILFHLQVSIFLIAS